VVYKWIDCMRHVNEKYRMHEVAPVEDMRETLEALPKAILDRATYLSDPIATAIEHAVSDDVAGE
jgi:hypothetical protein